MFELTGDTILAGAREAARRQGIGPDGVSDKARMAACAALDAAAEEGPDALAAAEAAIDPTVLASLDHLDVPRSKPATVGLSQLGTGDLSAGQAVLDGAIVVDDTVYRVAAINCYRQPIALDGQLHADYLEVTGQVALDGALARKTGLFRVEDRFERHRTFEFAVAGPTGTVHYRRTRGGLERVEAPPVAI